MVRVPPIAEKRAVRKPECTAGSEDVIGNLAKLEIGGRVDEPSCGRKTYDSPDPPDSRGGGSSRGRGKGISNA